MFCWAPNWSWCVPFHPLTMSSASYPLPAGTTLSFHLLAGCLISSGLTNRPNPVPSLDLTKVTHRIVLCLLIVFFFYTSNSNCSYSFLDSVQNNLISLSSTSFTLGLCITVVFWTTVADPLAWKMDQPRRLFDYSKGRVLWVGYQRKRDIEVNCEMLSLGNRPMLSH